LTSLDSPLLPLEDSIFELTTAPSALFDKKVAGMKLERMIIIIDNL
jgi:hypothetical protein